MKHALRACAPGTVKLLPSEFLRRYDVNRRYVLSLKADNLLRNHRLEARLWQSPLRNTHNPTVDAGDDFHWGWESPTCQVRGQFLGHHFARHLGIAENISQFRYT